MLISPSILEIQHFQNLTLKIQGQGQMTMMLHNYRSRQFHRTSNGINPSSVSEIWVHKVWPKYCLILRVFGPWASPYGANGQITMMLHNYRSRPVHETLNRVNPSCSFRDMCSAKSGPNLWQIWQVFGPWASPYGAMGKMTMTVHKFHRTSNGENPSSSYRYMCSASLAAARPLARNRDNNTPPARRAEG